LQKGHLGIFLCELKVDGLESDAISAALKSIRSLCILGLIQNSQYMTQTEKKMSTQRAR